MAGPLAAPRADDRQPLTPPRSGPPIRDGDKIMIASATDRPTAPAARQPVVSFYRLVESAPEPQRADRSGMGSLPTRAYRHCDAVTMAAGYGWHIRPAIGFELLWDGEVVFWRADHAELQEWMPLGAVQYPDFAGRFDATVPDDIAGYAPPFLTALQEPGVVQIWTGLFARTAPGWSLLVRNLANLPRHPGFEAYEGLVEADRWFGPLFTNIRLLRTGMAVRFDPADPFLQVQPVPQAAYADGVLGGAGFVRAIDQLAETDWDDYRHHIVAPNRDPQHRPGAYAAEGRRRRKAGGCPYAAMAAAAGPAMAAG
jgi:hypothetical protein